LEILDDCELVLLKDTTDCAGVGSCAALELTTDDLPVVLSDGNVDNEGLETVETRVEGGAGTKPAKLPEPLTGSVKATEALRSAFASVVAAD
jgi:hypothetical protein